MSMHYALCDLGRKRTGRAPFPLEPYAFLDLCIITICIITISTVMHTTVLTGFVIRIRSDCRQFRATTPEFVNPLGVTLGPPELVHRSYIHPVRIRPFYPSTLSGLELATVQDRLLYPVDVCRSRSLDLLFGLFGHSFGHFGVHSSSPWVNTRHFKTSSRAPSALRTDHRQAAHGPCLVVIGRIRV